MDPVAQFVVAHYGADLGLPIVVLSCNRPGTRAPSRTRALSAAAPAVPRRTPSIIDADTLVPVDPPVPPGFVRITGPIPVCTDCYSRPRIPAPIADAARRAPQGSRFLAFVGRVFPGAEREAVRAVLQAQGFWPAEVRPEPKYPKHEARRDGKPVRPGDRVHDFRGEAGVYEMISRIPEPEEGKTGKVIVDGREFYAKVWGLEIVEVA